MGLLDWIFGNNSVKRHQEYLDCMLEIEEAKDRNTLYFEKKRLERERFYREMDQCIYLSQDCSRMVIMHRNDIPDEDFKFHFLCEGFSAFLPISIGPFIKPWET